MTPNIMALSIVSETFVAWDKCQWNKYQTLVRCMLHGKNVGGKMSFGKMSCETEDCGTNNIETGVSNMGTDASETNVTYDKCQLEKFQ
jgi:hypothetical protein